MFIPDLQAVTARFALGCGSDSDSIQLFSRHLLMYSFMGSSQCGGSLGTWLHHLWSLFVDWISQPQVKIYIITWAITFTIVCIIILGLGFGPAGVGAGTLAAAFQSSMYSGFTPASGLFATLTSMGMLGIMMPWAVGIAGLVATLVTGTAWAFGAAR
ncbi:Putative IFI6/IFI27-like domain superfamily protein [Colletotrichum destructivum]|uniref:IFI6/IFI27-like domain superfamily protein n=1 Tax=Colletotrichum destructivum TaxID=34406 RepID=A0AAX4IXQ3_9PEZI|nr:Putative IFI6/IFI27-like domain superfamily protein [Colletotrichum destructivum]